MAPFAYIDPASGSLIIQALIAIMIGAGIYFRKFVLNPIGAAWRFITFQKAREPEQQQV